MRSSLFWDVTRSGLAADWRRFGTGYQSHLNGQAAPEELITQFIGWLTHNNEL